MNINRHRLTAIRATFGITAAPLPSATFVQPTYQALVDGASRAIAVPARRAAIEAHTVVNRRPL